MEELELYVYDKYIKNIMVEENGIKKIARSKLDELNLTPHERGFITHVINKHNIEIVEEKITKKDRSGYIRDNSYGDIKTHDLGNLDETVKSKIEYSPSGEKIYEDYTELDEYLETRFIPTYVLLKQRKNENGEVEKYPSIRLQHIMALKLSEAELEHVMNYLSERNIRVGGRASTLDSEFDNYDYVTTYKESALPLTVPSSVTQEKIRLYKQNQDQNIKNEIITDNMRLVPYVAYRYAISTGINQHELESYGYEGLILALEKYEDDFGCLFSTYAISYIRGYVLKGIREITCGKNDYFYWDYVNAKFAVEKERGLTLKEAPELIDDVVDLLIATGKVVDNADAKKRTRNKIIAWSLDSLSLSDEEAFLEEGSIDMLVDPTDYSEIAINSVLRQDLEKAIDTLPERMAEVIRLGFGFNDGRCYSLEEIGKIRNASAGIIRQIDAKALRKLRHPKNSRYLKDYLD